jgi:hypothetical protein
LLLGSATVDGGTIANNIATGFAGGVYVKPGATAELSGVAIAGNTGSYGGGVCVYGDATLTNVEISGNTATIAGGGAYIAKAAQATFAQTTIADNVSRNGGVYVSGEATFRNSIVVDEIRKTGTANAFNVLSGFTAWTNAESDGVVNFVYDETLSLFADGGYALAENSQALDKGDDSYAVDAEGNALTTDLAGNARIVGAAVDLGAYESQDAVSSAFAESLDDFDFFVDEEDLEALASRLI